MKTKVIVTIMKNSSSDDEVDDAEEFSEDTIKVVPST